MDDDSTNAPAQGPDDTHSWRLVRCLTVTRLAVLGSAFGMSVAASVLLIVALVFLATGNASVLRAVPEVGLVTALFVGVAAALVPRIEQRLLAIARRAEGPTLSIPLLETLNGLYIGRLRVALEQELARLLGGIDAEWWQDNRRPLGTQVSAALAAAIMPNALRPADGPLLPALLDTIARCGRKEFLRQVEQLERAALRGALPAETAEAAQRCGTALRERALRDRQAATLLRPAIGLSDTLLRPAGTGAARNENLLRSTDPVEDAGAGLPRPASADARPDGTAGEQAEVQSGTVV